MAYRLEFTREVVTRDGYDVEIEADSVEQANEIAERMAGEMDRDCPDEAAEIGPAECRSWSVADVVAVTGDEAPSNVVPMRPATAPAVVDRNSAMNLPMDVWEGMLRAVQLGVPKLGMDDRAAIAALASLKAHVHIDGERIAASR